MYKIQKIWLVHNYIQPPNYNSSLKHHCKAENLLHKPVKSKFNFQNSALKCNVC